MDKKSYDFIRDMQFKHWWFKGRSRIVGIFLARNLPDKCKNKILDIGSGFGALIPKLKRYGSVDALEPYKEAQQVLKKSKATKILNLNFPAQYPKQTYDLVTMFDVLEHLENDTKCLKVIRTKLLNDGGKLILTVPAYNWLWSCHDNSHDHLRRYSKQRMLRLLAGLGYKNIRISYFVTFLFPLAMIERMIGKCFRFDPGAKMPNRRVNAFFNSISSLEAQVIRRMNLPYGMSLIVMADK